MTGFANRVARRPWSVPGLMLSAPLSVYGGWAVVAIFSDPDTYECPAQAVVGLPVQWLTLVIFLLVVCCAAICTYRLAVD